MRAEMSYDRFRRVIMWIGGRSVHVTTRVPKLVSRQFDDEVILANFETDSIIV